ncbi:MAG: type IV pilus secretin PilQ [Deltaproteobacteria bacterium]|nr:type IV pilus secretin PilQ [Deltaproteobacteria bacterium]
MNKIQKSWRWGRGLAVLALLLLFFGCATENGAVKKDAFFEKWETAAQQSPGHSPATRNRVVIYPEAKTEEAEGAPAVKTGMQADGDLFQSLSKEKITLRMRQADIKSVIRALARATGKNIIVKNDIKGELNVDFTGVPFDQAFINILRSQSLWYLVDGDVIRVVTMDDLDQGLKLAAFQDKRKVQGLEGSRVAPLLTMVMSIDYAVPDEVAANLQDFLTKDKDGKVARGSVKVNKSSNSIIVQAIREDLNRMIPIVEKLDQPPQQINIKASIVETTKDTARNLGIQWGGAYGRAFGNGNLNLTGGGTSATIGGAILPTSGAVGLSGNSLAVNFPAAAMGVVNPGSLGLMFGSIGGNILEMQLNALQQDNKLNILSSPSITTMDNQMAYTSNGERVPYVTQTISSGTATNTVTFEEAVLRLEITPHVIDGKSLRMKIIVKKDEVDTTRNVQGNPFIIKKQTETNLIVADGETIVISGLSKQTTAGAENGIPGLKDIPVLGWLFKGDTDKEAMQEVLIFITPKILPPQVLATAAEGKDKAGDIKPAAGR